MRFAVVTSLSFLCGLLAVPAFAGGGAGGHGAPGAPMGASYGGMGHGGARYAAPPHQQRAPQAAAPRQTFGAAPAPLPPAQAAQDRPHDRDWPGHGRRLGAGYGLGGAYVVDPYWAAPAHAAPQPAPQTVYAPTYYNAASYGPRRLAQGEPGYLAHPVVYQLRNGQVRVITLDVSHRHRHVSHAEFRPMRSTRAFRVWKD
ncbi:MAG: hypothetical protein KGL46_00855 [Hyphomicrobiales bacterium]|nr:hypothetical protein [Hyphomicrobiales bacterium]